MISQRHIECPAGMIVGARGSLFPRWCGVVVFFSFEDRVRLLPFVFVDTNVSPTRPAKGAGTVKDSRHSIRREHKQHDKTVLPRKRGLYPSHLPPANGSRGKLHGTNPSQLRVSETSASTTKNERKTMQTNTIKTEENNKTNTASPAGELTTASVQIPTPMSHAATAARSLARFINPQELEVLGNCCRGEEREYFKSKLVELAGIVDSMPVTYQTNGQCDQAIVWLHYFNQDCDWYIVERDCEEEQLQAFGLCCIWEDELGYVSIKELVDAGVELDLYWTPRSLGQVKAERKMQDVNYVGHPMHY